MGCGCELNCEHNNQKRPKQRVNQTPHFGHKPNRSKNMQLDSKTFAYCPLFDKQGVTGSSPVSPIFTSINDRFALPVKVLFSQLK